MDALRVCFAGPIDEQLVGQLREDGFVISADPTKSIEQVVEAVPDIQAGAVIVVPVEQLEQVGRLAARVNAEGPRVPLLVLDRLRDPQRHARAILAGACDYICLSEPAVLPLAIRQALETTSLFGRCQEAERAAREELEQTRRLTEELKTAHARLKTLAAQAAGAETRERKRLAKLMHDNLQQLLVASRYSVERIRQQTAEPSVQQAAGDCDRLLNEAIDVTRCLAIQLAPPALAQAGLLAGLRWLAEHMMERFKLQVNLDLDERADLKDENLASVVFQLVREALFNVVKHAEVSSADVVARKGDGVTIEVVDRGVGFVPEAAVAVGDSARGLGLGSARERMAAIGGSLDIISRPRQGCRVVFQLPVW